VVLRFRYHALEGRWYLNLSTKLSREGGTEISVPCSREEVVHKFLYQALEEGWY